MSKVKGAFLISLTLNPIQRLLLCRDSSNISMPASVDELCVRSPQALCERYSIVEAMPPLVLATERVRTLVYYFVVAGLVLFLFW